MAGLTVFRGDYRGYTIRLPLAKYQTGCKLFFGAKLTPDADITDASAIAKVTLTDSDITSTDANYKYYLLALQPSGTTNAAPGKYIGEVQFVDPSGKPTTYKQFDFTVTADINRRTT